MIHLSIPEILGLLLREVLREVLPRLVIVLLLFSVFVLVMFGCVSLWRAVLPDAPACACVSDGGTP